MGHDVDWRIDTEPVVDAGQQAARGLLDILAPIVIEFFDVPVSCERENQLAVLPLDQTAGLEIVGTVEAPQAVIRQSQPFQASAHDSGQIEPEPIVGLAVFPRDQQFATEKARDDDHVTPGAFPLSLDAAAAARARASVDKERRPDEHESACSSSSEGRFKRWITSSASADSN